jgi:hypothetical protein
MGVGMRKVPVMAATICVACLCFLGCNSGSTDEDEYDDIVSQYDNYTVASLWAAMEESDDANGKIIILRDEVYDVQDMLITLVDSDSGNFVDCAFEDGFDLSDIASGDVVTIRGKCYYITDDSSYPELRSCDYLYVNSQG